MSLGIAAAAYDDALAFLYGRIDYERAINVPYGARDFRLDRMRQLLRSLGDPQQHYPIVHVAGTKGKGSTAAMIAAVLTAAGRRTGLFTSPHLHRVEERLRIDGLPCTPDELVGLVARIGPLVQELDEQCLAEGGGGGPTYFDLNTAMAMQHFADRRVDAAVLEVGLGGRLDSTNVCQPSVAVITSISFDHMRQLGHTLAAIAWEKAGIVKPGVPTISGVTDDEPRRVIEEVCQQQSSRLIELGRDFTFAYHPPREVNSAENLGRLDYRSLVPGAECARHGLALGLLGRHQGANAAVCLATIDELNRQGWSICEEAIRRGLATVSWPARLEVIGRKPTILLDAAHNVASIEALLQTVEESFQTRRRILVFGTTRDKEVRGMLTLLGPRFDEIICTRYRNNPRSFPPEELAAILQGSSSTPAVICEDPTSAWEHVQKIAREDDLVCITGSFFLAAEMRLEIQERPIRI